jgi:peptidyl-prolyl cis-trans isomerase B (cyclophilin B)
MIRCLILSAALCLSASLRSPGADTTYVRFDTNLGFIDVQMLSDEAPQTVQNFLTNAGQGVYNGSVFDFSLGFIIEGGGYTDPNGAPIPITATDTIPDEAGISNTRGTLSMALPAGNGNMTNEWAFNVADNSSTRDSESYVVFGVVANSSSLAIMDEISTLPTVALISSAGVPLPDFPLLGFSLTTPGTPVVINSISVLSTQSFSDWQSANLGGQSTGTSAGATPQKDGATNLLKYVCNINPAGPMSAADRAKLPVAGATTVTNPDGTTTPVVTLTYHQNTALVGVNLGVETSTDLQTWTPVVQPTIIQTGIDSANNPILQVQVPISGGRTFVRLNVTQQ